MRTVLGPDHEAFRDQARRFIGREIVPHYPQFLQDGLVPKQLWRDAGDAGMLCLSTPEEYGGAGADFGYTAVLIEEMYRAHVTGIAFTLHSDIVAPYILAYGNDQAKHRWLPRMVSGEMIGAIAMTEPGTGSDLKAIRTTATRDGDQYVINGQKTYISNGINAGLVIVAAKTDPDAGHRGVSLIVVEDGTPGFTRGRKLAKIGLHAQDTAELFFDDVRVPIANRLGEENVGFRYLMHQLPQERLIIALGAAASMEAMLQETINFTRDRKAFGQAILDFQNTRFKLADAKAQATMFRVFVDDCLRLLLAGELTAERAAMAKLVGTEMQGRLLDDFVQLHGGAGFMAEYPIARAWADARIMRIYGGSSEIMREIIAKGLI